MAYFSMQKESVDKIIKFLTPIIAEEGCELIDAEVVQEAGRKILRLYIDKQQGVNLKDCQKISHAVEDVLEVEGFVQGAYHLEVSSLGLNRPLKTREHFEKVVGKKINVLTKEKINGRRRFCGLLKEVNKDTLTVVIDNKDFIVPLAELAKANLEYSF